ncbi:MAG: undecaprenyl-diphosphate phosphatase [Coriobacteriales bacterium]|jgi:undecaprenyl-diphosphatase|nr:undecaprenyl-diphosphate phosphatase [Coriobacteriales bacterium]
MDFIELLKALLIGIVEGITEWLPISSTGHMILFDEFVKMNVSPAFLSMFLVVIQLGAIMAVIVLYFHRLNPLSPRKSPQERRSSLSLWAKVIVACVPAAIAGFLLNDWVEERFFNAVVVACALIIYGIAFIVIERLKAGDKDDTATPERGRHFRSRNVVSEGEGGELSGDELDSLSFPRAFAIGLFQCLAIIPGTSRSGSTILGGRILGVSRRVAAEFSFFLAIPVMFGWSLLKVVKGFIRDGLALTSTEWGVFAVGVVVAFVVSILAIRFLMGYIKRHSFEVFGWYRIVLGALVLIYFAATNSLLT